jgi:PHD/YefM family antitoxin component YafN of YafNO toxin-antitoxin module
VTLSVDEYDGMIETLEILRDPRAVSDLAQAEAERERGEGYSLEDLHRVMAERLGREELEKRTSA